MLRNIHLDTFFFLNMYLELVFGCKLEKIFSGKVGSKFTIASWQGLWKKKEVLFGADRGRVYGRVNFGKYAK